MSRLPQPIEKKKARAVIGGDICPINANEPLCVRGDAEKVFSDLLKTMLCADICVVNLESPLIERPSPIKKSGPVIGARKETVKLLPAAGIHAVSLANNHIMDHGPTGFLSTISALEANGVNYFGAGPDLDSAQKILVREVNGLRVGLLGVTQHEFSVAGRTTPGAAPMDPVEVHGQVRRQEDGWDVLLALVHAGPEHYPLPTPKLQKYCRFLVDIGASAVFCQHSHCAGAYEKYNDALIVYGQGNLLFDWPSKPPRWFEGFLVDLELTVQGVSSVNLVLYERGEFGIGVRPMERIRNAEIIRDIEERCHSIEDPSFVENTWIDYCSNQSNVYYQMMLGGHLPIKVVRKLFDGFGRKMVPLGKRHRLTLLNLLRCESHRDVLESLLSGEFY